MLQGGLGKAEKEVLGWGAGFALTNHLLKIQPSWGRGGGEKRRLWKAIYLLTPYAMFSKLSSLWEEEEDEERPLLVDNLVTKGSCEVICPDCQCSRKAAHGFCHCHICHLMCVHNRILRPWCLIVWLGEGSSKIITRIRCTSIFS